MAYFFIDKDTDFNVDNIHIFESSKKNSKQLNPRDYNDYCTDTGKKKYYYVVPKYVDPVTNVAKKIVFLFIDNASVKFLISVSPDQSSQVQIQYTLTDLSKLQEQFNKLKTRIETLTNENTNIKTPVNALYIPEDEDDTNKNIYLYSTIKTFKPKCDVRDLSVKNFTNASGKRLITYKNNDEKSVNERIANIISGENTTFFSNSSTAVEISHVFLRNIKNKDNTKLCYNTLNVTIDETTDRTNNELESRLQSLQLKASIDDDSKDEQ